VCPPSSIRISRWHVENALTKARNGEVSERQLMEWATMILINDVFYWSGDDADLIGEWISRLSLDLISETYHH
jgi:hypothetical protein